MTMASSRACRSLGGRLRWPLQRLAMGREQDLQGISPAFLSRTRGVLTVAGASAGSMFVESLNTCSSNVDACLFSKNPVTSGGSLRITEEDRRRLVRFFSGGAKSTSKVLHASTNEEYSSLLERASKNNHVAVVDFTATWCAPCRNIAPVVEDMSKEFDDVLFIKVDIDEAEVEETVKKAGIRAVPTFIFHKAGKKVAEFSGADAAKLREIVTLLRKG